MRTPSAQKTQSETGSALEISSALLVCCPLSVTTDHGLIPVLGSPVLPCYNVLNIRSVANKGRAMRDITIIGVPVDLGAGRRGVDMGPSAIRYAGLKERLDRAGLPRARPGQHRGAAGRADRAAGQRREAALPRAAGRGQPCAGPAGGRSQRRWRIPHDPGRRPQPGDRLRQRAGAGPPHRHDLDRRPRRLQHRRDHPPATSTA